MGARLIRGSRLTRSKSRKGVTWAGDLWPPETPISLHRGPSEPSRGRLPMGALLRAKMLANST
eukprot:14750403-Alexandrium_andersonii.AAC.1